MPYHFMLLKPFLNILQLTSLRRRGNARSVSFGRWPIYIINLVEKPNYLALLIAELAKRSSIIIQNSSNPSSRKNLDVRPCDRTTVRPYDRTIAQGATFNMRGELYRGHANATALSSSPVVGALGSESDDPDSSPGRGKAQCP